MTFVEALLGLLVCILVALVFTAVIASLLYIAVLALLRYMKHRGGGGSVKKRLCAFLAAVMVACSYLASAFAADIVIPPESGMQDLSVVLEKKPNPLMRFCRCRMLFMHIVLRQIIIP